MSNRIKKVPVVTGVSSDIGIESSLLLSKNGFQNYVSMRDLEKSINTLKVADMENFLLDRQGQQQQHDFVQESR
jgi:NADP-dependent 3-hydroxy acid dehydrogenase YdfG